MFARRHRIRSWHAALVVLAAVGGGCRTTELSTPLSGRGDAMGRSVGPLQLGRGWAWLVESGSIAGRLPGPSERMAEGLSLAIRSDTGLPASAATQSIEERQPVGLPVGMVRWPEGAAGTRADVSGDVFVEWMIGLRERGSCRVEIDLVPRLTPSCGAPVFLESLRIQRTVTVGDSLVLSSSPAGRSTGSQAAGAAGMPASAADVSRLLVGARPGEAGRFVVHVRR